MFETLSTHIKRFLKEEDGTTTVEYAVLLMLIILVFVTSIQVVGNMSNDTFEKTEDIFTASQSGGS
jgi:pilus assembly protein Flp/PilA